MPGSPSFTMLCNRCKKGTTAVTYWSLCDKKGCGGRYIYAAEDDITNPEKSYGAQTEPNLTALKEENKKLSNENKSLKAKVLSMERLVTVLKEDMRELFTAKNELSAENGRLNALVEEKEQEVVDLWSEIAYERNAHQETKIELENVTNKLAKSSGNTVEKKLEVAEHDKRTTLEETKKALEKVVEKKEQELVDLRYELADERNVHEEIKKKLKNLVEEKEQELVDLWSELADERNTHEEEKSDLTKTLDEVRKELLDMKERNQDLKEQCESKEKKIIGMHQNIDKMSSELTWERVQHDEAKKQLEVVTKERDQMADKLKNVNANVSGNKLMEQIVETNLNLSAALAKLTMEGVQKTIEETKTNEPFKQPEEPTKKPEKPDVVVPCGTCGMRALIPEGKWMIHCKNKSCLESLNVILAPVQEGHKIVRRYCKGAYFCTMVPDTQTTLECGCCKREFEITNLVVEIRNNQKVYDAKLKVPEHTEIKQLKNKLNTLKEQHEFELNTIQTQLNNAHHEIQANKEKNRFELLAVEEKNKKLIDEMKELQQEKEACSKAVTFVQRENELILEDMKKLQSEKAEKAEKAIDLEKKLAHLNEINVLLMKKMQNDPNVVEKKLVIPLD